MRPLITGCAGFIGSHLTETLLGAGHEVVGVDCFNDNYSRSLKLQNLARARDWNGFDFRPVDLARSDVETLVDGCDVIFHLAAEPGVHASWGRRFVSYILNNIAATQNLLEATRMRPGTRFVYASSSSIYGQAERFPTSEDTVPAPLSPYGVTKLAAEHLCTVHRQNFGVDAVMLRYFSVYGPRQRPDMAFNIFCRQLLDGEPIVLYGGDQTRDFTFVADVVQATIAAASSVPGHVFNIGGGSRVSLLEAVRVLCELADRPVVVERAGPLSGDVRDTSADIGAARHGLGYAPATGIREGLEAEWEWAQTSRSTTRAEVAA